MSGVIVILYTHVRSPIREDRLHGEMVHYPPLHPVEHLGDTLLTGSGLGVIPQLNSWKPIRVGHFSALFGQEFLTGYDPAIMKL